MLFYVFEWNISTAEDVKVQFGRFEIVPPPILLSAKPEQFLFLPLIGVSVSALLLTST